MSSALADRTMLLEDIPEASLAHGKLIRQLGNDSSYWLSFA
ncbi:hypothetical protein CSC29_3792 [Pseudomonas aeruginosa]|nr:hypothetical protein CSC29_3792 [Pseudomonas aeruginosa]